MSLPFITKATEHHEQRAIIDTDGSYTYHDLLTASERIASCLLESRPDLQETRVAFMVPAGFAYVATLWGIWRAGGIAVPLCLSHPLPELAYVLDDTNADIVVVTPAFAEKLRLLTTEQKRRLVLTTEALQYTPGRLPTLSSNRRALILYTSGTTSRPKGVVTTHQNIEAQITSLIEAWAWVADDHILHILPLHHTHGIVNVLLCALWAGATCEMMPAFDAKIVWNHFVHSPLTVFMAVPTIYRRLIAVWEEANTEAQKQMSVACATMRLMVSGSAALPVRTLEKWKSISGHTLLERYGMTEIGMALSNPYDGERRPGFVGHPLPRVRLRLVDEEGRPIEEEGPTGEIQVQSPAVFLEYWNKPDATQQAFKAGWFCTGDIAMQEAGYYRILGRQSVDIIKTGGYKVSALEIEEVLRTHPNIKECAVVGLEDPDWGERVGVALVATEHLTLETLRTWAKTRMALYKVPSRLLVLDELPQNVMGKVMKPAVKKLFIS